ncbi:MAG TPA: hypothetical protein VFA46_02510 [Actinomycetes bacterium]|nr:hypothetical protein [Actinomycetes bacterium]
MDSRRRADAPPDRVVPPRPPWRRPSARDEALARVSRWKRGIAVAAVVGFGALLGLVGVAGARGSATTSTPPPASDRSGDGHQQAAQRQAPDDGFFGGGQRGGFGFGSGSQGLPFGRSSAS